MPEHMVLLQKLRQLRREAGISLEEWMQMCGVCKSNLARYETGDAPSLKNALKIARFLKMPVEQIWRLEEETKNRE